MTRGNTEWRSKYKDPEKILEYKRQYYQDKQDTDNPRRCYYCGEYRSNFRHQGKQRLHDLMLEIIGEDHYDFTPEDLYADYWIALNKQKAEQRQKANDLFKGDNE